MKKTRNEFDLIVIGGGSGGIATANRAAEHGASVLLFEEKALGGTCVNVGCVPKKVMWAASNIEETLTLAKSYGYRLGAWQFDWTALVAARQAYIEHLNGLYQQHLLKNGVTVLQQHAECVDAHCVVASGQRYQAKHVLLATGGHPIWPDIEGAEYGIDSDGFFAMTQQPKKVAVVGAGYIAVELAGLLNGLGSEVTMVLRKSHPLRQFDEMLSSTLLQQMQQSGITIASGCVPTRLQNTTDGLHLHCDNHSVLQNFDCVIWAIGRRPNLEQLNLAAAGVALDARGYVQVDAYQNTNVPGVYAVGDIIGRYELTPVAIAAGRRLAMRLFAGDSHSHFDYHDIATVVFSHPPIATIGLTEQQAREQYTEVTVFQSKFTPMLYALSEQAVKTSMKLICVGKQQRVVGCHMIGSQVDEIMQGFAVAIKMGATKKDFDNCVAIHPTSAEELVTLR